MSLLQSVVTQVLQNAVQGNQQQAPQSSQGGLGGLLGGLAGSVMQGGQSSQAQQGGLGGLLGSVVSSQLGGNQTQGGGLDAVLGGLLGGQQQSASPTDLGGILGSVLGGGQSSQGGLGGLGGLLGANQGGGMNKSALLVALLPVVLAFIQKNGGLSGVMSKFNGAGLQSQAQSWVNVDSANDGLDANDVMQLFGDSQISQVCQQTGASQGEVCQGIAELLPTVVNELTPEGSLATEPQANAEIDAILSQIKTPL